MRCPLDTQCLGEDAEKGVSRRQKAYPGIPTRIPFPREKGWPYKKMGSSELLRERVAFLSFSNSNLVICLFIPVVLPLDDLYPSLDSIPPPPIHTIRHLRNVHHRRNAYRRIPPISSGPRDTTFHDHEDPGCARVCSCIQDEAHSSLVICFV